MDLSRNVMMQINDIHKNVAYELQDELINHINQMTELDVYSALYIELHTQLNISIFEPTTRNFHKIN